MKGSTGWVIFGVIVIFVLFVIVRLYYHDAMSYKLKHQDIVFGEVEILKVKNTLLLAEKSLPVTWNLSSLRQIFDASEKGFGSEFWHKINPLDKSQIGKIPSDAEIKSYIETELKKYRGFDGVEDFNGVGLAMAVTPEFTLEDAKITSKVSGKLKTFAGDKNNPSTQSQKIVESSVSYSVHFKKLTDAGRLFAQAAASMKIPAYSGNKDNYKTQAENSVMAKFNGISTGLDKKFAVINSRLLVPSPAHAGVLPALSGMLFYYLAEGQFTEKQSLYHYLDENVFEKRPFSLTVKAEDYLVALDCAGNNDLFTFSSSNDMACDGSRIYTCTTFIEGIGGNLKTCVGGIGQSTGTFGCGESGFKKNSAVDDSSCYCTAFGGTWVPRVDWTCPKPRQECAAEGTVKNDKGEEETVCTEWRTVIDQIPRSCPEECEPRNKCPFALNDCSGI